MYEIESMNFNGEVKGSVSKPNGLENKYSRLLL